MSKKLIDLISFVLVLSIASNASAELVAHWPLDEGSGTTAYDISGNELHGTLQGDPQWVAGKIGGALEFDGNGDYINCGNDPIFDITEQVTLTVWVNANDMLNSQHNCWLGKGDNTYAIKHQAGNYLEFFVFDGDWHSTQYTTDIESINGDWHHMAGTFDGYELKFYLDGELKVTLPFEGTIGTAAHPVTIGENSQATGRFFDGMLDDPRIYNNALTPEELLYAMQGYGAYPYAMAPTPADGVYHPDTWVNLSWRAGDLAVSHDVYLGENFDDVDTGAGGTFQGNQTATSLNVGLPGGPYPDGLVQGTTYYWRIDEVEADGTTVHKGDVWSFTTAGGLRGEYCQWSGQSPPSRSTAFSNLVINRVDSTINFNWGLGAPDPLINADNFSVRWTGEVKAGFTETYTFYTNSDDGVRLWVDGQQLIDDWYEHPATENSGKIDLVAGQMYNIVMEMFENLGGAVAQLRWSSLHTPKQLIPQAALSPGSMAGALAGALDTALSFATGGSADWFAQTTTSRYDGDAAQSPDISHRQESWMQTTVNGAGTVKFYWKVSSEEDFDFLEFYIDGSLQDRISGLVNWQQKTYTISTSGSHTLEWRYMKDGSGNYGSDCGWVDKVQW